MKESISKAAEEVKGLPHYTSEGEINFLIENFSSLVLLLLYCSG